MSTVTLIVPGDAPPPARKMVIIPDGGDPIQVPYADPETGYSNLGWDWAEIGRPNDKPLTARAGGRLTKVALKFTVADPTPAASIELLLAKIGQLGDVPVTVVYGIASTSWATVQTGRWVIADMDITVTQRVPGTNDANRADVSMKLTEYSPLQTLVSVGGVQQRITPRVRLGIVLAGETLQQAVARYYPRDATAWRRVAEANGYRDVRGIPGGTVLVLP